MRSVTAAVVSARVKKSSCVVPLPYCQPGGNRCCKWTDDRTLGKLSSTGKRSGNIPTDLLAMRLAGGMRSAPSDITDVDAWTHAVRRWTASDTFRCSPTFLYHESLWCMLIVLFIMVWYTADTESVTTERCS